MATTLPATSPRCVNTTRSCRSSLLTRPAQFFNAIYVVDGDKANPSNVHIYDAAKKSWSTQATTPGAFDPSAATMILDHDTNVMCMSPLCVTMWSRC